MAKTKPKRKENDPLESKKKRNSENSALMRTIQRLHTYDWAVQ